MLFATLNNPQTYSPFLGHPIWTEALDWLRHLPVEQPAGIHHLRGEKMYANLHGYETQPRDKCRYESHRVYIDLQYCITGGELIEWHPLDRLQSKDEYDPQKDVLHYHSPTSPYGVLRMVPGNFAVFFPQDGHMPKLADGVHPKVTKVVIKIDLGLLG